MKHLTVCIYINVTDAAAFRQAARDRALEQGLPANEAKRYLGMPLSSCALMLFDPGIGPEGCDIEDSSAEAAHDGKDEEKVRFYEDRISEAEELLTIFEAKAKIDVEDEEDEEEDEEEEA